MLVDLVLHAAWLQSSLYIHMAQHDVEPLSYEVIGQTDLVEDVNAYWLAKLAAIPCLQA
jgi:hypothetical protein